MTARGAIATNPALWQNVKRCHNRSRFYLCTVHCTLYIIVAAATTCHGQDSLDDIRARLREYQPLISADGAVRVMAREEFKGFRSSVLKFCSTLRQRLANATGIKPGDTGAISIVLGDPQTAAGTSIREFANFDGFHTYRIGTANPETLDIDDLGAVVAQCVLNNWLAADRPPPDKAGAAGFPLWFADGFAVFVAGNMREANLDEVFALMQAGRLPPVMELLRGENLPRPVASTLVAWLYEAGGGRAAYQRLHKALAGGMAWTPEMLAATMPQCAPAEADEKWDVWLQQCRRRIFHAGSTPGGLWTRLRRQLFVFPVDYGWPLPDAARGMTFAEFANQPPSKWRRRAAEAKILALGMTAVGRDRRYQEVIDSYCDFLKGVIAEESVKRLRRRLAVADARYTAAWLAVLNPPEQDKEGEE